MNSKCISCYSLFQLSADFLELDHCLKGIDLKPSTYIALLEVHCLEPGSWSCVGLLLSRLTQSTMGVGGCPMSLNGSTRAQCEAVSYCYTVRQRTLISKHMGCE